MKAQLAAVQKIFWVLLICSAAIAAAASPLGENGRLMKVRAELVRFRQGFDRKKLEAFLFAQATGQGEVALADIATPLNEGKKRLLSLPDKPPPIMPLAAVELGSLASVSAFCGTEAATEIGSPLGRQIANSLLWRLSRREKQGEYELQKVELRRAPVAEAQVELEKKVIAARDLAQEREKSWKEASRLHDRLDARYATMRKRRAHWRPMLEVQQKRDQARVEMDARKSDLDTARAGYEELAGKAEKFAPAKAPGKAPAAMAPRAAATVTLKPADGEKPLVIELPASLAVKSVPIPPLTGCDFAVTRAAGIWDQVADLTAEEAISRVEAKFSWHYGAPGRAFLQVVPVALLGLLGFLFMRIRKAAASYNPFDTLSGLADLPRVGLKPSVLNLLVILALPLLACVLCIWSLMQIDVIPAAPILCALLVLGLGALCYLRMNELSSLRDAVTRSHRGSQAPPKE